MFQKKSNIDESQSSHTKYDCQYHIVFINTSNIGLSNVSVEATSQILPAM